VRGTEKQRDMKGCEMGVGEGVGSREGAEVLVCREK
jgi:hypothetical protein